MTHDWVLHAITGAYALCNVVRLLFYVPQILAVLRDPGGACAISISTWIFWTFSHAVTTVYCSAVVNDTLLAVMMLGNTVGSCAIVGLTISKRSMLRRAQEAVAEH